MDQRDGIREVHCRSDDVKYYHRGKVADELRGDSKIASGLKKIINGDFKGRVFIQEEAAQEENVPTGRQVAWMIYEYSKVIDTDESFLDFYDNVKVGLKNGNVESFHTRWDETIIAMKEQPDDEILDNFYDRQLQQSQ